jgi:hypothetical protein
MTMRFSNFMVLAILWAATTSFPIAQKESDPPLLRSAAR